MSAGTTRFSVRRPSSPSLFFTEAIKPHDFSAAFGGTFSGRGRRRERGHRSGRRQFTGLGVRRLRCSRRRRYRFAGLGRGFVSGSVEELELKAELHRRIEERGDGFERNDNAFGNAAER